MMSQSERIKENTKKVWGASPAGTTYGGGHEKGSREFFESVMTKRSGYECPWLDEVVNFEKYKAKKVLEIGCGAGYDAYQFCKAGALYTGIDITPENPILVKKHLGYYGYSPDVREFDVEKMSFDQEYDFVYSFGVLHHVPNIQQALLNIHRSLKPGGEFLIIVYNKHSIFYWLQVILADWIFKKRFLTMSLEERISEIEFTDSDARPLVRVYSKRQLKKLLRESGFSIVQTHIRKLVREDLPDLFFIRRCYKYF